MVAFMALGCSIKVISLYSEVSLVGRSDFSFCVLRHWGQTYEKKVRPYIVPGKLQEKKCVLRKKSLKTRFLQYNAKILEKITISTNINLKVMGQSY
jgi:hypothetical protein